MNKVYIGLIILSWLEHKLHNSWISQEADWNSAGLHNDGWHKEEETTPISV